MTLLKETEIVLRYHRKSWKDVLWIGNLIKVISIEDFKKIADQDYQCALRLLIVGSDFWLERVEHTEYPEQWWVFKSFPIQPKAIAENSDSAEKIVWHPRHFYKTPQYQ